jgi:microcystin-dependent protein
MTQPVLTVNQQGQGAVSADQLNTFTQWCNTINDLRNFVGLAGMTVLMLGTASPSDGGQGYFWWNPASTVADDGGVTTIMPNGMTGPGRWNRLPITVSSIPPNSISLSQLQTIPADTILGNNLGSTGNITALTVAQVNAMLGASAGLPTGAVIPYTATAPPGGWLICDGTAYSRTTYANLNTLASGSGYAAPFGPGDGSTTFNVPDLRGYFVRGWDSSGSIDPGRTFGTTQLSALQSHVHIQDTMVFESSTYTGQFGNSGVTSTRLGFTTAGTGTVPMGLTNDGTPSSGYTPNPGGQISTTESRPRNVALVFIVKT